MCQFLVVDRGCRGGRGIRLGGCTRRRVGRGGCELGRLS